ncbi:MAG: radical SAM protein [Desulfobacterota bacterium]|nr:radical SAM protein [Thermodesulfobacteriota bacterium]
MKYVFGPVPSRRLGYSLGIDVIPFKTCTLDCVYCQLGPTTVRTLERRQWVPENDIIEEIKDTLARHTGIDYLTFSGSGEPTLHAGIGRIIREIQAICAIPIAVITNGTLLFEQEVREGLMSADLVIPSVDCVSTKIFQRLNRPHPDLRMENILRGLETFSHDYSGALWVEIMIARGFNDTAEELECIAKKLERVRIDKIQINTVTRPPSDTQIEPASREELELARDILGERAEIIGDFTKEKILFEETDIRQRILHLLQRHPDSARRISAALGISMSIVELHLRRLADEGKLQRIEHAGEQFYRPANTVGGGRQ